MNVPIIRNSWFQKKEKKNIRRESVICISGREYTGMSIRLPVSSVRMVDYFTFFLYTSMSVYNFFFTNTLF